MDVLYDRTVTCLVCKQTYTTKKVRSRFIRPIQHDTDFCSHYASEEANPLLYYVHVCPHCGFAATEEFSTYFPPRTLETIEQHVRANWRGKNYGGVRTFRDAVDTYKLGIYCATLKKEKHIAIAGLYMRLAWLYRSKQKHEEEKRCMRFALEQYVASYEADDFVHTHMSEVRLLYLIGELYRRLGNEKQAIIYFSRVIARKKETIEKGIVNMAYDRWQDIREEKKGAQ